ncbi:MAG: efflux RND transporter periplasmic adaptor subunit [Moraxella sp.]|nr:efflux RND transporter periplasmic adaptor subunit [Moraxella sp.]
MKKNLYTVAMAAVLTTSILAACSKQDNAGAAAGQQMPPAAVDVQVVTLGALPMTKTFSGRTSAYKTSEVRPQVTGIIDEILFQEGSIVQAGQPLYRINIDNYRSSVASGEAAVVQARANVSTAQANLIGSEATLAQAQADLARYASLLEVEAVSKQTYDQAVTAVNTARASVEAMKATLRQSQAAVNAATANLSASQLDLNRTIIRAPISGKSGISAVTAGALVASGQATSLVTISQLDPIYVDISQSSSELLQLREQLANGSASQGSTQVELVLEDGSSYPIKGQITLASAQVDETTGAVTLRARFANPNQVLLPGMYVNARLAQTIANNATLLPQTAVTLTPKGGAQVYIVDGDNKVAVREVTTSGTHDGQWLITDGLQDGDKVIVNGGAKVKAEQVVAPTVVAPTAPATGTSAGQTPAQAQPALSAPAGASTVMKAPTNQSSSQSNAQANAPAVDDSSEQNEAAAAADSN